MTIGIKIAQLSKNALQASDKDLSLSSTFKVFKIYTQNTVQVDTATTKEIAHGLGYRPNFLAFMADESDSSFMKLVTSSVQYNSARGWIDTYNLYLRNATSPARETFYYIFYDPIEK